MIGDREPKPDNMPRGEIPFLGRVGRRHHVREEDEIERLAYLKDEGRIRRSW